MCDIVAASITTNTALEFARRLEEDVAGLFERHGGVERMLMCWYMATCQTQGQDPDYRSQPDDALNFEVYDSVAPFMWPTYRLLGAFVKLVGPTNIPIYKEGFYGTYDPSSDRRQKSAREKHQEDTVVLMEILPEFALLCRMRGNVPVEDELVRALRTAFDTKQISLSTVLAVQVFLDIHHRMRDQVYRGLIDMEKAANQILSSIDQHQEFHASLTIDTWPRSNDAVFRLIKHRIDTWAKGDPIMQASIRHNRPPPSDRHLLSKHPLLCGLIAYGLKMDFNEAGIALANAWGATVCCTHLYNAVRQTGLLQSLWKDMEIMRGVVQMDAMLGSTPPGATHEVFLQRFMLSMGYSAAKFAPQGGRKHKRPQVSRSGPRGLKAKVGVAEAFRARYSSGGGTAGNFTHEEVRALLGKLNAWEEDADMSDEETFETEEGETQQFGLVKSAKARNTKAARMHQQAIGKLTVDELLEKLRNALQGEVLELSFDYALMHRFCWRLLRAVKDKCAEELQRMYGPSYIEKESELPFIVGYILHASVAREQAANYPVFESRRTKSTNSQLLDKVAYVIEEMIASGAGSIVAIVLERQYNIFFEE